MTEEAEATRWICYPDPDRVCLEGGCGYCIPDVADTRRHRKWTRSQVERYAAEKGIEISDYWIVNGMRARATK